MILDFLPLVAGILSLVLALIVLINGTNKKNMRWPFVIFAASVGVWAICISLFILSTQLSYALFFATLYYLSPHFIAYGFLLFSLYYSSAKLSRTITIIALVPWLIMSVLIWTPYAFIDGVNMTIPHTVILVRPTYLVYGLSFVAYVVIGLSYLTFNAFRSAHREKSRMILAISLAICLSGGAYFNLILPWFGDYRLISLGPLFTFLMVVSVFYVIARHGLFDIRQAVVRTVTYVLSLMTLASVYLLIAYVVFNQLLGQTSTFGITLLNVILTMVLAFLFQPVKRFFDHLTNRIFYRDVYSVEDFFARLTKRLSIITDLNVLLQYSSSEIRNTLKASFGAFYIYQIDKPSVYVATDKRKKLPKDDADMLNTYVTDSRKEIIITKQLTESADKNLKRMLDSHRIALVLPIIKDSIITGYLFLGEHLSAQYTAQDTRALLTIADELTIAIQNALSVQQVRDINETLQQRVNEATKELRASNAQLRRLDEAKDEFVSMASHQLRTPLTSIKGYISMVREGDVGKISEPQDQMLGQAFASSERMVHLINDFLNVSRLQTGKFMIDKRPVNLAKVIEQELDSLVTNAKSRNLEFTYTPPKHFPTLNLDEDKMRQVIMNFSDNAIYYSAEGTKIKVKLAVEGNNAVFSVTDTGIGVPHAEQSQLFSKFYRASNARRQRPDGTGVGLFLAKMVIDSHGGKVLFNSIEGKGSTFGFSLPIDALSAAGDADNLDDQNNNG